MNKELYMMKKTSLPFHLSLNYVIDLTAYEEDSPNSKYHDSKLQFLLILEFTA